MNLMSGLGPIGWRPPTNLVKQHRAASSWTDCGWTQDTFSNPWSPRNTGRDVFENGTNPNPASESEKWLRINFLETRLAELRDAQNNSVVNLSQWEGEVFAAETELYQLRDNLQAARQKKFDKELEASSAEGEHASVKWRISSHQPEEPAPGLWAGVQAGNSLGELHAKRMELENTISQLRGEVWQLGFFDIPNLESRIAQLESQIVENRRKIEQERSNQFYYEPDITHYQQELDHLRYC